MSKLSYSLLAGLLWGALPVSGFAQEVTPGANVVRFDALAVVGANFNYNFWNDHGLVFPLLLSYERRLAPAWSLGAEVLLNGGDPTDRRHGFSLSTRRYLRPNAALSGFYAAPTLSYRSMRVTDGYYGENPVISTGSRLGPGLFMGWQHALGRAKSQQWTVDLSVGAMYWRRVGTDKVDDVNAFYRQAESSIYRNGLWVDMRGGIGYQF